MVRTHTIRTASGRLSYVLAKSLAIAFATLGAALSAGTAIACLCASADFNPDEYDAVFSGLVISTERSYVPMPETTFSDEESVENPGYWVKSRILVMRIWRGAPSTVAEVWTPVVTSCDSPPIVGFYFVALVRPEKGRDVASNSWCDYAQKRAATKEVGAFAVTGIAIATGAIGAATVVLVSLFRVIRRHRSSR